MGDGITLKRFSRDDVVGGLKSAFHAMSEAVGKSLLLWQVGGDPVGTLVDRLFGLPQAFRDGETNESRAWRLVERALLHTLVTLVRDWPSTTPPPADGLKAHFIDDLVDTVADGDVVIDLDFFANPSALPILAPVKRFFLAWLERHGLSSTVAATVAGRFDGILTRALRDEWLREPKAYEPVLNALNNPFASATLMQRDWESYRSWLIERASDRVFEEPFGLADVYIRLRAAYTETIDEKTKDESPAHTDEGPSGIKTRSIVVDLHREVEAWLDRSDRDDTIRLIKGGPGSGKSCFVRMLAAELAERTTLPVLLFPLQRFGVRDRLIDAVGDYLTGAEFFSDNPLTQTDFATPDKPLLLIFDGLDELTKPGQAADAEARRFLDHVSRQLEIWNTQACRVFALITGRTVAIQSTRDVIRQQGRQELEVLPYHLRA